MITHRPRQRFPMVNRSNTSPRFPQLFPGKVVAATVLMLSLGAPTVAAQTADPLETVNRVTFKFNQVVDSVVFKPLANTYQKVTPRFAKNMIGNFFDNLGEVPNVVNDVLQLEFGQAANDLGRLAVNSTLGVGGLFEVADPMLGLSQNHQDFGRTLAHWGVEQGPYVVLPLFGPSTLRDSVNIPANIAVHPVNTMNDVTTQNALRTTRAVDIRADLLLLDNQVVGDPYLYQREAYLQHREYTVNGDDMMIAFEEF